MSSTSLPRKLENIDTRNIAQQYVQLHGKIKVNNYKVLDLMINAYVHKRMRNLHTCIHIENSTSAIKCKN